MSPIFAKLAGALPYREKPLKSCLRTVIRNRGPQSEEDIAAQVKAYNEALARLKTMCES
jgi:hypothetical protein